MGRKKCEHGRERRRCKDCGGSGLCEHGRERTVCKDCGGSSSLCEHGRQRSTCKECGGGGHVTVVEATEVEEFDGAEDPEVPTVHAPTRVVLERSVSARVGPPSTNMGRKKCEHGRRRSKCKECGGGGHVTFVEATEVEEFDGEEDPDESVPTVQARVVGGSRGGKRKRYCPLSFEYLKSVPFDTPNLNVETTRRDVGAGRHRVGRGRRELRCA